MFVFHFEHTKLDNSQYLIEKIKRKRKGEWKEKVMSDLGTTHRECKDNINGKRKNIVKES